jgi:hypothetical protein
MIYFRFEDDFVEENVRCIPMIVRMKLDICGIKLKLAEWSKLSIDERTNLANSPCETNEQILIYRRHLEDLVFKYTRQRPTYLETNNLLEWIIADRIPYVLQQKLDEFESIISLQQWKSLSSLQRFALVKLSRPGHENANFPKAMEEFGLLTSFTFG